MNHNTFEEKLDYLLYEQRDFEAYHQLLSKDKDKYYHLAERLLEVSKFDFDELDAWLDHHGHYEMSAIGFFASMIESRREQEAEDRLNNLQLAVNLLASRGIEGITVPMLLNGSHESEELLDIAMKIIVNNQDSVTSNKGFVRSSKQMNKQEVRNTLLQHLIEKGEIKLDNQGACDLKKQDVWEMLSNNFKVIIDDIENKKIPSNEYPKCLYEYVSTVGYYNIFTSGQDDFFKSSKNKPIKDIIKFKRGRKSS